MAKPTQLITDDLAEMLALQTKTKTALEFFAAELAAQA